MPETSTTSAARLRTMMRRVRLEKMCSPTKRLKPPWQARERVPAGRSARVSRTVWSSVVAVIGSRGGGPRAVRPP